MAAGMALSQTWDPEDTERLLDEVFDLMARLSPADNHEDVNARRISLAQGKEYMYCMGLNYEEWAEDVDPKQATNPKQTGKQVWELKIAEISAYGDPLCQNQPKPRQWFDKRAWKDYHRRMIEEDKLASHDQKTEQRIQKQLKDELHRLKKWFSQGEQRSCWEGYTCIDF